MKICLITTTIHIPHVLKTYRAFAPDADILVAGDRKTKHGDVQAVCKDIQARYYSDADQEKLGSQCSDVIGWNTVRRRNLVLLEAIRLKPDVIITIDDDNLPINADYFSDMARVLLHDFNGLCVAGHDDWFDVGVLASPPVSHRGFPHARQKNHAFAVSPVTNIKVGVAAGLWLGDPDTHAAERMVNRPSVTHYAGIAEAGVVVKTGCFTPFNSQNTGYRADLAALMPMLPGTARYDDIWASYVAERVMMETGDHVHFGKPFVWQERHAHNQLLDLKDEIYGMEYTERFIEDMKAIDVSGSTPLDRMRRLYNGLAKLDYLPPEMVPFGRAWCADVDRVLSS